VIITSSISVKDTRNATVTATTFVSTTREDAEDITVEEEMDVITADESKCLSLN
jgi:hypothetical protein